MILLLYFRFLQIGWFRLQVYFLSDRCFFHKYYINFGIIFAVEAGEKILQQAYNNKVYEYCEKYYYLQVNVVLFYCKIDTKERKSTRTFDQFRCIIGTWDILLILLSYKSFSYCNANVSFFVLVFFGCYIGPFHLDCVRTIETTYQ